MRERFNELNGARVPRTGEIFKIPVEQLAVDDYGNLIDVTVLVDPCLVDAPVIPDPGKDGKQPPKCQHTSDPCQPVYEFPPAPGASCDPQNAPKHDWNQQVTPNSGQEPGQKVEEFNVEQPTLVVSGVRRRPPPK